MIDNSGKIVTISYAGTLKNGWQFMGLEPGQSVRFPCIEGWMPPEFIEAVRTMDVGETKQVRVSAADAYQARDEERIIKVPRSNLAADSHLKLGDVTTLLASNGQEYPARLVDLTEDVAVFDANHDAIGQDLFFEITLLDVQDRPRR